MRQGRMLLCALFLFFLVLAGRSLVRGPVEEAPETMPSYAGESAMLARDPGGQADAYAQQNWHAGPREHARAAGERCEVTLPALAGDGNGQLLSRWTWHRSVYWVCPPEGMPG